jgi:hypothetical protein
MGQRWEYRVGNYAITERWNSDRQQDEIDAFGAMLNEAGTYGWELIGYETVPTFSTHLLGEHHGLAYLLLFKRPFEEGAARGDEPQPERVSLLPYPCPYCPAGYETGPELYEHKKTHRRGRRA